jgi:hypothetical protein
MNIEAGTCCVAPVTAATLTQVVEGSAMQVYEAAVKGLESAGVDTAFGGNGENIASLALALDHSRKIRSIMTRHEQAASFMACGYAMYTNRLGVCFSKLEFNKAYKPDYAIGSDARLAVAALVPSV